MKKFCCIALALFVCSTSLKALAAEVPAEAKKQTRIGKYVTAREAFAMYEGAKDKVIVLDVRTPEEYDFVGHPAMAYNIPVKLWTGKFDAAAKRNVLADNPGFVEAVAAKFGKDARILAMCRSGDRSAVAVNRLAEAGFTDVFSVVDGFEGDAVTDKNSPDAGKRVVSGWKNSANPWTYDLDERLVYVAP